ncbi:TPA: lipase [Vibrio cholerae]|uniref:lipase family protein n=1 Tax=Vibrio cholerae TaxID=666 RepID=UPI0021D360D5|nr:lipase [Vibrio cholerae]MCU4219852.1 lipase [Vibrio cholerae]HCZ9574335.1 lipase [Vibrio cholerae]HCZ9599343.1 lipase [Vibrio cholerae]HCZ9603546.1 lipase [Vibrio cholerae]HCZ9634996.1 lipase [Vibrio cholerae]
MDSFNYCVQCNPEENWLELEFRSENDEPIDGLLVTITNQSAPSNTYTQTTSSGKVLFGKIAAGEWRASVSQASLLTEVEKYASRKEGQESPVKKRAAAELDAADKDTKQYRFTTIGDFWDEAPEDEFLQEQHKGIDVNASAEKAGFRLSHNQTYVFEIKALRSYMPVIIDTDEFSLVNSYTFALLSKLAYATDKKSIDLKSEADSTGSIGTVINQFKSRQLPIQSGNQKVRWLVGEIPYSRALNFKYYDNRQKHAQGYILFNEEIAIVSVRGTEPSFYDKDSVIDPNSKFIITKVANGIDAVLNSPGINDLVKTDLDAAQIAPNEFGGAYVHQGFYQYSMALWENTLLADDILKNHATKRFYLCGHSLGGAGALLLSALIKDSLHPSVLRLYTYGMPRTGTRSFVTRYQNILHYRHVNNHDLVAQIPMTWANTDLTEGLDKWDVFSSGITLIKKMLTDNDDDNYLHHGHLSQLLTYQKPDQILLTPRQTQVTMLDMVKLATNDSVSLVNNLSEVSIAEHGMDHYVPNLWQQLFALSNESLMTHYQKAISALEQEIAILQQNYLTVKQTLARSIGDGTPAMGIGRLMSEMSSINKLIENRNQIRGELKQIVLDPQRLPLAKLLIAQQTLPDEIKEQLQ